ncbi:hypothetical protein GT755_11940 [Herbidospora sp. NEAU-GS84]|uniref:Uncharacterized protein n=2 Tax=Herbidospora solisilvae TaxID=2696284 RepID=A0A7C9N6P5_9ACTN|nr:hypothetical protein [Herbidospora solisilvae]
MMISISLVLLLGLAVFIALRFTYLRFTHALLCILFGFYLSETAAAPEVRRFISIVLATVFGIS